jgi:hypothetical protein
MRMLARLMRQMILIGYVLTSFSELWKRTYPKYIAPTQN